MPGLGTFPLTFPGVTTDSVTGDVSLPIQDLLLDEEDEDIVYLYGDLLTVHDTQGIAQACRIALRLQKGEWFLRPDDGIDWRGKYLGVNNPDLTELRADVIRALLGVAGVTEVVSVLVDLNRATRRSSITFEVLTDLSRVVSGVVVVA